jgi:hypothetical protein
MMGFIEESESNEILQMPIWLGFTATLALLGVFTIRSK